MANLGKSGVSVGYYDTEEAAAKAYDRAAIGLLGRDNCSITTNFPLTAYDEDLVSSACTYPLLGVACLQLLGSLSVRQARMPCAQQIHSALRLPLQAGSDQAEPVERQTCCAEEDMKFIVLVSCYNFSSNWLT